MQRSRRMPRTWALGASLYESEQPDAEWRMADGGWRTPNAEKPPASGFQLPAASSQRPAEELMRPVFGRSITTVMWSRDDVGRIDDPIFRRTHRAHSPLPGCRVSQEDRRPITASWSLEAGRWCWKPVAGGCSAVRTRSSKPNSTNRTPPPSHHRHPSPPHHHLRPHPLLLPPPLTQSRLHRHEHQQQRRQPRPGPTTGVAVVIGCSRLA